MYLDLPKILRKLQWIWNHKFFFAFLYMNSPWYHFILRDWNSLFLAHFHTFQSWNSPAYSHFFPTSKEFLYIWAFVLLNLTVGANWANSTILPRRIQIDGIIVFYGQFHYVLARFRDIGQYKNDELYQHAKIKNFMLNSRRLSTNDLDINKIMINFYYLNQVRSFNFACSLLTLVVVTLSIVYVLLII